MKLVGYVEINYYDVKRGKKEEQEREKGKKRRGREHFQMLLYLSARGRKEGTKSRQAAVRE
jgi:hypothetical protein